MSREQTLYFRTQAGGSQQLKLQNLVVTDDAEFFNTQYDEAINGSLRSNLRGTRRKYAVSYALCGDPDVYRSICNNIATDLQDGLSFVYVGIESGALDRVTLDDGFLHRVQYANQHGLFVPELRLIGFQVNQVLGVTVEDWRFVNESVTESRDYGLITSSVTTQQDYGFIV